MIEEKLSKKVTVLFTRKTDNKLNEICHRLDRSKSNLLRYIIQNWIEKNMTV